MRIMMFTRCASLQDGINRHILNVIPELNKVPGVQCAVCIVQPAGELGKALNEKGVRVYSLDAPNCHALRCFYRCYRVVRQFKPDIFHDAVTGFAIRIVAKFCFSRIPWVCTSHGFRTREDVEFRKEWYRRPLVWLMDMHIRKLFYVSPDCMRQDERLGVYTPEIRRPGLNPLDFDIPCGQRGLLRKELGLTEDVPLLGTACRIAAIKRPQLFTEVMCRVLLVRKDAHAVIIGDGPELEHVRAIVRSNRLEDRIHLLGYRQNVRELDQDLDVFVLTSELEGMPTAALEAVSAGATLAMLKIPGGVTDIANASAQNGDFAVIADSDDVGKLAEGILNVLKDSARRRKLAKKAIEICREEFGMQKALEYFMTGYQEVMAEQARR